MLGSREEKGKLIYTYTPYQIKRASEYDVTENGIPYIYDLYTNGAYFFLLITSETSQKEIAQAKKWLRHVHDVVGISLAYPE